MSKVKRIVVAVSVTLVVCAMYGGLAVRKYANTKQRGAVNASNMMNIWGVLLQFENDNRRWPSSPSELKLGRTTLVDAVSGEALLWNPDIQACMKQPGEVHPLVWQPKPYRTSLWPFGQVRQWALYSDGNRNQYQSDVNQ